MSLKFGIYLVEQRIISPEQFCGLVKIQQEASMSFATIAIRKNMMTIKQVAHVLDAIEVASDKSFVQVAMEQDLIDRADADQMIHLQQMSSPSIRKLVVECGLLTQRQTSVLFMHFEKHGSGGINQHNPVRKPKGALPQVEKPEAAVTEGPRQPKFQQRPAATRTPAHQG
ncbi:MAG: hypothetical protein AAFN77_17515 [Planctomycetota bacterium]